MTGGSFCACEDSKDGAGLPAAGCRGLATTDLPDFADEEAFLLEDVDVLGTNSAA